MPKISLVLLNIQVLPYLEYLFQANSAPINKNFFKVIISLNIRHFVFQRVLVNKEFSLSLLSDQYKQRLNLLYLDIIWTILGNRKDVTILPLIYNLLCLIVLTLKSFIQVCLNILGLTLSVQLPNSINKCLSFRRLQNLKISSIIKYNPTQLNILIQLNGSSPIQFLKVNINNYKIKLIR